MLQVLIIIDVLIAIAMIALILLQRGPGATAGAAFGSGASGTVFGARGSANFLSRTTGALATAFFVVTLLMAVLAAEQARKLSDGDLGVLAAPAEQPAGDAAFDSTGTPAPAAEPGGDPSGDDQSGGDPSGERPAVPGGTDPAA